MNYQQLLAEYQKQAKPEWGINPGVITVDGQQYVVNSSGGIPTFTADGGGGYGNTFDISGEDGYKTKDTSNALTGFALPAAALLAGAYGINSLGAGAAAGAGDVAAMGMDQVGAMGMPEVGAWATPATAAEEAAMLAGSGAGGSMGSLTSMLGGTGTTLGSMAANGLSAGGLLDAVGGVKGALTIGGGLLGAAGAKDGTTTQTKEPWAPMQPYLLDNANNIKNWYAQNGNGGAEANRLAAQIPQFNQQQAQAGQGLLSMANNYARRKGL